MIGGSSPLKNMVQGINCGLSSGDIMMMIPFRKVILPQARPSALVNWRDYGSIETIIINAMYSSKCCWH